MAQLGFTKDRFRALDAWRGICALFVVLFHVPVLHLFKDAAAFANLQLCVDFFFVLSGFVISHAYQRRIKSAGDGVGFLQARFLRLWPLHAVVLAGFIAFEFVKLGYGYAHPGMGLDAAPFSAGRTPYEIVTNLLFLQAFNLHPGLSWNGPAWSIAVEFWTSVVFALVLLLLPRARVWAFLGLAAVSAAILAVTSPTTLFVSSDWGFFRCLLGFCVGCLVYDLRLRLPTPRLPFGLAEMICVGFAAAFVLLTPQGPIHLAAPLVFAALIYVFSFEVGPVSKLLVTSVPQALGRWSLSIYMTHTLIFQLTRTAGSFADKKLGMHATVFHNGDKILTFGTGLAAILVTLAIIALVVVPVGAFFCRFVEKPLSRLSLSLPGPSKQRMLLALRSADQSGTMQPVLVG